MPGAVYARSCLCQELSMPGAVYVHAFLQAPWKSCLTTVFNKHFCLLKGGGLCSPSLRSPLVLLSSDSSPPISTYFPPYY